MPINRVTGNSTDGIVVLRVARDKEYDLVQIAERFEVPYVEIKSPQQGRAYYAMVEGTARAVGKLAIERYDKYRHWRFYSSRPVTLDVSAAQFDLDKTDSNDKDPIASNQGSIIDSLGKVAYVLKMWFIIPKIEVEVITPEESDPEVSDGLVNPYKMPEYVSLEKK